MALQGREADVQRLDVGELAALHHTLLHQLFENASTPSAADTQLVGQRLDRFRDARGRINEVANTAFFNGEFLLDFDGTNPRQVQPTRCGEPVRQRGPDYASRVTAALQPALLPSRMGLLRFDYAVYWDGNRRSCGSFSARTRTHTIAVAQPLPASLPRSTSAVLGSTQLGLRRWISDALGSS
jgi:hypothetical protein